MGVVEGGGRMKSTKDVEEREGMVGMKRCMKGEEV